MQRAFIHASVRVTPHRMIATETWKCDMHLYVCLLYYEMKIKKKNRKFLSIHTHIETARRPCTIHSTGPPIHGVVHMCICFCMHDANVTKFGHYKQSIQILLWHHFDCLATRLDITIITLFALETKFSNRKSVIFGYRQI